MHNTVIVNGITYSVTGPVTIQVSEEGKVFINNTSKENEISLSGNIPSGDIVVTGDTRHLNISGICQQVAIAGNVGRIRALSSPLKVNGSVQEVFSQSGTVTADSIGTVNTLHGTVTPK